MLLYQVPQGWLVGIPLSILFSAYWVLNDPFFLSKYHTWNLEYQDLKYCLTIGQSTEYQKEGFTPIYMYISRYEFSTISYLLYMQKNDEYNFISMKLSLLILIATTIGFFLSTVYSSINPSTKFWSRKNSSLCFGFSHCFPAEAFLTSWKSASKLYILGVVYKRMSSGYRLFIFLKNFFATRSMIQTQKI